MRIPGPKVGYTDLLDFAITEKLKREAQEKGYFPLRPSNAGKCGRQLAYNLMEYRGHASYPKDVMSPEVYRLLQLGHSVEYSALRNFELVEGISLRYKQQTVTLFQLKALGGVEQEIIEGSNDALFFHEEFKGLMDVKSAKDGHSSSFRSRWDETLQKFKQLESLVQIGENAFYASQLPKLIHELGDDFLVDNLLQCNLYACAPFFKSRGVDHGVIYKYNKNTSQHYELRFAPSDELFTAIEKKYNAINKAVYERYPEKMEREFNFGTLRCSFCPYSEQCWGKDAKKAFELKFSRYSAKPISQMGDASKELQLLFKDYVSLSKTTENLFSIEQAIIKILIREKVSKIRLTTGQVFEIKHLKSPKPHFELRKSK